MNGDLVREYASRRRARMRGVMAEPITRTHLTLLLEAQEGRCRYCRRQLQRDMQLDHRTPLARGGAHAPSNVCRSCPPCNRRKRTKTEAEFLKEIAA
jgi:5-methylcytosine-specific restriction endonuclease McrA